MGRLPSAPALDPLNSHEPTDQAPAGETTILVIDDDPTMGTMLTMLGREHGFTVQVATDGFEGLRLAEQSDADLIVPDLNLPRLTGLDVCRRIRAPGIQVPSLVVSAHHDVRD